MIHLKTHQQSLTSSFCPLYVVSHKVLQTLFFYNITFFPFPPDQSPWFLSSYHSPDHLKLRLWQQSLSFCSDFPTKYYRWSGWNSRNLFLTVLEARKFKIKVLTNSCWEFPSWSADSYLPGVPSHSRQESTLLSLPLLIRGLAVSY